MKYGNKKTYVDGIAFDSAKEACRYGELKILQRAGKIRDLELQPEYILQPAFTKRGKRYRKIAYKADFRYFDIAQGCYIVEDAKGFKTDVYKLKKKLFEYKFDEEIKEV